MHRWGTERLMAPLIAARTPPRTTKGFIRNNIPVNTKHLCNICTMLDQRRRRWADVVRMLYKCFVFAGIPCVCGSPWTPTSTAQQSKHPTLSTSCIPVNTKHLYNICITFVQCRPNVGDVGPTLYKCYTNGLCLLRWHNKSTWIYNAYNVGPASETLCRRCTNVIQMVCVCWDGTTSQREYTQSLRTMLDQRRRRCADVVQMVYKWFVSAEMAQQVNVNIHCAPEIVE